MSTSNLLRALLTASALLPGAALAEDAPAPAAAPAATAATPAVSATATPAAEPADAPKKLPNGQLEEPKYPLSGSVGLSYGFNHANFVPTDSDKANFATGQGSVTASASYGFLDKYSVGLSLSANKELKKSYYGANSTALDTTSFGDSSIGLNGHDLLTIPFVDIGVSASLSASIPTSKASQAKDVYTRVGPGISLGWSWDRLSLGARVGAKYTWAKHRTVYIQTDSAGRNADIAGANTGRNRGLWSIGEGCSLGVRIVEGLDFSFGYNLGHSTVAAEGRNDQYTNPRAQTGTQWGFMSQSADFGLDWNVIGKTTVSLGMSTDSSRDYKGHLTNPFFDTATNTHENTNYSLSVSQGF